VNAHAGLLAAVAPAPPAGSDRARRHYIDRRFADKLTGYRFEQAAAGVR